MVDQNPADKIDITFDEKGLQPSIPHSVFAKQRTERGRHHPDWRRPPSRFSAMQQPVATRKT
jgi:hypothetical protein